MREQEKQDQAPNDDEQIVSFAELTPEQQEIFIEAMKRSGLDTEKLLGLALKKTEK